MPNTRQTQFSSQQCDALFAAVLINDVVDAHTQMPERVHFDYEQNQLIECFHLCKQVWLAGFNRHDFSQMVAKLQKDKALSPEDQLAYKHVRAKFKQLRFAHANFDARHTYPTLLNAMTTLMGNLQDNFKNKQHASVGRSALLLRVCLTALPCALIDQELNRFRPTTVDGFRQYVLQQMNTIRTRLTKTELSSKEFHGIRKIISRQASFYVALTVLYPSPYHTAIFRSLSAINGMMGSMHDDLVIKEISGEQDYHTDTFTMPADIKSRLYEVVNSYLHNA